jgi:hypothetical protein
MLEIFHGGIFPQIEAVAVRFPHRLTTKLFSICRRQSGVIRNGEVANFARNENYFDTCTQAICLLSADRLQSSRVPNSDVLPLAHGVFTPLFTAIKGFIFQIES